MVTELTRHPFSVEDYDQMIAVGILGESDRVELIEGEIIAMAAQGDKHIVCINRLTHRVNQSLQGDLRLSVQNAIRIGKRSKPEPDLAIFHESPDAALPIPTAENTILVMEVADSSLNYDRVRKLPLYAEAAIPEAWLFDLVNRRIERHTEPRPGGYRLIAIANAGESLASTVLPGLVLETNTILGR